MSCFIVPMVQAVATTVYRKANKNSINTGSALKRNVPALEKMLWGGTLMLVVDHIINGELTYMFPFLTAFNQSEGWSIVLRELLTVGVPMSLVLTAAWAVWALLKERKSARQTVR